MSERFVGDLRERAGAVECWDGAAWRWVCDLGPMSFAEASIRLCAPLGATEDQVQRWVEKSRAAAQSS